MEWIANYARCQHLARLFNPWSNYANYRNRPERALDAVLDVQYTHTVVIYFLWISSITIVPDLPIRFSPTAIHTRYSLSITRVCICEFASCLFPRSSEVCWFLFHFLFCYIHVCDTGRDKNFQTVASMLLSSQVTFRIIFKYTGLRKTESEGFNIYYKPTS